MGSLLLKKEFNEEEVEEEEVEPAPIESCATLQEEGITVLGFI